MRRRTLLLAPLAFAASAPGVPPANAGPEPSGLDLFEPGNLVAWCIVPYDARRRGPEERAAMLRRLGISRFAYDWRAEHLPTLDAELDALRRHGIRLEAVWFPAGMEPEKEPHVRTLLDFLRRRGVKAQLWLSLAVPDQGTQAERVAAAVRPVRWVAAEAGKIGCRVGLYNHGGWFGEPENQIAIVQEVGMPGVGLVYNFHHGHDHIDRFPALFREMVPHLLAVNLNGMRRDGPKILGIGRGDREREMLRVIAASDYRGPVGILGHQAERDAEEALRENLDGLRALVRELRAAPG